MSRSPIENWKKKKKKKKYKVSNIWKPMSWNWYQNEVQLLVDHKVCNDWSDRAQSDRLSDQERAKVVCCKPLATLSPDQWLLNHQGSVLVPYGSPPTANGWPYWGGSYPSAEVQSAYSTPPANTRVDWNCDWLANQKWLFPKKPSIKWMRKRDQKKKTKYAKTPLQKKQKSQCSWIQPSPVINTKITNSISRITTIFFKGSTMRLVAKLSTRFGWYIKSAML